MDPFIGEIRIFGNNYPSTGWAVCNGQLLSISGNTALFAIIGIRFGGNGTSNFALPDLQGRAAIGSGQATGGSYYLLGEALGTETVTMTAGQVATHSHNLNCFSDAGDNAAPAGQVLASCGAERGTILYNAGGPAVPMNPKSVSLNGNNMAHNNISPFLGLNICIALQGSFEPKS